MKKVSLREIFEEYDGFPHQLVGIDMLEQTLDESLLDIDSDWINTFRAGPKYVAEGGFMPVRIEG